MDLIPRNATFYFWCGLAGVLGTGLVVGMGGDNYWALSAFGSFDPNNVPSTRGHVLMFTLAVLVAVFDLCALGVILPGGVVFVQRLRRRL
jgi:hypothetical protein